MPIGKRFWRWFEPMLRSAAPAPRAALVGLLAVGAFCYVFLGPLVFDAAYWVLGKVARARSDARLRVGVSLALVVVYVVALGASGSTASNRTAAVATSTPFVAANAASPTASPTVPASASATASTAVSAATSASPIASAADPDDETSGTPGASFVPDASGILPPTSGGGPADRLPGEPDPSLTPGALNPAVTQATINSTICVSGWTATIRPSSSYTGALKVEQIAQYGYSDTGTSSYEEDHLISLELGGAPADPRNLWPEPYAMTLADGRSTGAYTKDGFETKLKNQVCAGTITLAQAQTDIGDHWVHAYYGIPLVSSTPAAVPSATPVATVAPTVAPTPAPPAGAPTPVPGTRRGAVCKDGTTSDATGSGACSHHGGVDHWLYW